MCFETATLFQFSMLCNPKPPSLLGGQTIVYATLIPPLLDSLPLPHKMVEALFKKHQHFLWQDVIVGLVSLNSIQ